MILYTPLSETDIFPSNADEYAQYESIVVGGRTCQARRLEDGSFQLTQLLSTDPNDFFQADYQPGRIIHHIHQK
ncbi:hypothetical protein DX933_04290 [Ornithinibacillus gellani]|uniref:YlzJ-like family protein n=1 Tax=Ornithinibacillus gellani TaxID=2293253 RepID=UPI000F4AB4CE|nr:YlzJ-like family protein [Ornithinibacillus gellani]TQS75504.1 hypothetical protein DX933_04290 [Ornithinibacillus gellani]